jgi:glycosyltransferase involved in cell wall biosynthesis
MISVVILTFNEEANLERCLRSVAWCDDVLIIDSFSTDNTLQIAREFGARVIQRSFEDFATQRNFALDQGALKYDWVFHLDADEEITPVLATEIRSIAKTGDLAAYRVASKLIWNGQWLRHAGLFPWYQVRFGQKRALRFCQTGHGQRELVPPELVGTLRSPLMHYPFSKGVHDWIEKHNRYSTAEARLNASNRRELGSLVGNILARNQDERRRALKQLFARLPFRPTARFLYMFVFRGGLLDGRAGLTYCRLLAWYERMIVLKEREARISHRSPPPLATAAGPRADISHPLRLDSKASQKAALSILVPVKNEAGNLRDCLTSVSFADEIVVVDSASTDATPQIAAEFGARVVQFNWNGSFPRKKNWALENVPWQHEWVLIIDADERITPALEKQIQEAIQRDDVDGFYLNRRYWFLGGWINHSGRFPNWNLRLFRHGKGRYERFETPPGLNSGDNEVHEHVLLDGRAEYLSDPMEHYAFPDIEIFVEKHNRYATWEA